MLSSDFRKQLSKKLQEKKQYTEQAQSSLTGLELAIPGQPVEAGDGELYVVQPDLMKLCSEADVLTRRYCDLFYDPLTNARSLHDEFNMMLRADPRSIVFLDIETTGFSNTPLFLIGLLYFNGKNLSISQLFARDYSEEANLLHYFSEFVLNFNTLVTFNGKTFDVPFIIDRMIYHKKVLKRTQKHVDILHHSRRRWRGHFPDCKLQTLESCVCNRRRDDDIPSALVPEVYRDFVRTGNATYLASVFHHNALDLITLLELTIVLLS